ncbi:MAG: NAD+ synthase [Salinivirgaceae bacterium]|nr:NAD+ synthase [Salinivirgaceae bacterium]
MKIALAQLNYHIGNFELNTQKIINAVAEAKQQKADLVVFSELAICGYPPLDLLDKQWFIEETGRALNIIQLHCTDIAVVIGAPSINSGENGKRLFNSAYVIDNGIIKKVINKTLLPTYDVFNETRYFESNQKFDTVEINGILIGITICEDIWHEQANSQRYTKVKLYKNNPLDQLAQLNPALILNLSASPYSYYQENRRIDVLQRNAQNYGLPFIYVNQVGVNSDLIFDGASTVVNAKGEIVLQLKSFEEELKIINFDRINKTRPIEYAFDNIVEKNRQAIVFGVREFFNKNGFKKAVLGLSGGLDSALVATLATEALGAENVTGILMPSEYSSDHSVTDALELAKNLGIKHHIIPIKSIFHPFLDALHPVFNNLPFGLTEENLQARIRGTILMAYSNKHGHILLNPSNKSEMAVGYSTMYGDMNGALSVIGDIYKTEVFAMAKLINKHKEIIPTHIITKPPSAELRPDQKDSDSLPDYDILDKILFNFIERQLSANDIVEMGYNPKVVERIIKLVNNSEFKRFQAPPILRVSSKAFGQGRQMPLVAKYE